LPAPEAAAVREPFGIAIPFEAPIQPSSRQAPSVAEGRGGRDIRVGDRGVGCHISQHAWPRALPMHHHGALLGDHQIGTQLTVVPSLVWDLSSVPPQLCMAGWPRVGVQPGDHVSRPEALLLPTRTNRIRCSRVSGFTRCLETAQMGATHRRCPHIRQSSLSRTRVVAHIPGAGGRICGAAQEPALDVCA